MKEYCRFEVKGQKKSFREWFWETSNNISVWWNENKEWAIILIPTVIGLGSYVLRKSVKLIEIALSDRSEKMLRELYIYDRSLGNYWKLKRKLSASEMLAIENRRKAGEKMGQILSSMKVI